jgi:hypothetical protein
MTSRTGSPEIAERCSHTHALLGVFYSLLVVLLLEQPVPDLPFIVLVLKLL